MRIRPDFDLLFVMIVYKSYIIGINQGIMIDLTRIRILLFEPGSDRQENPGSLSDPRKPLGSDPRKIARSELIRNPA